MGLVLDLITILGLIILLYDKFRAKRFRCLVDGRPMKVDVDETKDLYRRRAFPLVRKMGKEVGKWCWVKNILHLNTKSEEEHS